MKDALKIKVPNRLDHLKKLREGNELQIVGLQVSIMAAEVRKKREDKEQHWIIEKKVETNKGEVLDLTEALAIINDEIKKESNK